MLLRLLLLFYVFWNKKLYLAILRHVQFSGTLVNNPSLCQQAGLLWGPNFGQGWQRDFQTSLYYFVYNKGLQNKVPFDRVFVQHYLVTPQIPHFVTFSFTPKRVPIVVFFIKKQPQNEVFYFKYLTLKNKIVGGGHLKLTLYFHALWL